MKPWLSKSRQTLLDEALRIYDVHQDGGAFEYPFKNLEQDLVPGIVRLGQACVRAADLIYTRRSPLQLVFSEEVEEVLVDAELSYERGEQLEGKYLDIHLLSERCALALVAYETAYVLDGLAIWVHCL